jgi:hypothetical protein
MDEFFGQRDEIMLTAAGTMKQDQWRPGRVGSWDEVVNVG